MKKMFVMFLALILAMSCVGAFADEEPITITVAHIGPTSPGPAADASQYGQATLHGAEIAVEEINAAGGKYRIELIHEDDQHDTEKVVNAYNTALDNGAQIILGTTTSKPCEVAADLGYEERVFFLTPSASAPAVIEGRDNIFQICFDDYSQGRVSAEYIAEHKLGTKIAVIYNNSDVYSTGIRDSFIAEAANRGLEIVAESTFTTTVDFSVQVSEAQNAGADVVFLPMYYDAAAPILITADSKDYHPIFFGVDGMDGILTVEGFDTSLAEGVMLLTPFVATSEDEKVVSFVQKYEAAYGTTPIQFAADAYDGIYTIIAAAEEAGITADMDTEEVCEAMIAAMQKITVEGLTGTMTWDETGAVGKEPMAAVIENGVYVFND